MKQRNNFIQNLFILLSLVIGYSNISYAQNINEYKKETQNNSTRTKHNPNNKQLESKEISGYLNGHQWIDLGLPSGTKWATMNIGAHNVIDEGDYYAWGEIAPATNGNYSITNCKLYGKNVGSISDTSYDVALNKWGQGWVIPEKKDIVELEKYCSMEVTKISGTEGYKITGPNGNSIFFPCTAVISGSLPPFKSIDTYSCYWLGTESSKDMGNLLQLGQMGIGTHSTNNKNVGYAIRAIARIK